MTLPPDCLKVDDCGWLPCFFVIGYWSAIAAIKVSDIAARIKLRRGCRVIGEVCSSDNWPCLTNGIFGLFRDGYDRGDRCSKHARAGGREKDYRACLTCLGLHQVRCSKRYVSDPRVNGPVWSKNDRILRGVA